MDVVIRTTGDPTRVTADVRQAIRSSDKGATILSVTTLANRLVAVAVTLNPDGSVPAGSEGLSSYKTTYSYDGTSNRVKTISQSDGTQLSFSYVLAGGSYKVASVRARSA